MQSGRLNSWRLLLYTRAITPPRVVAGAWLGHMPLRRGGWSLLLLVAVLAAGVAVRALTTVIRRLRYLRSIRLQSANRQGMRRPVHVGDDA
jgi:hypothetical protein